MQRLLSLFIVFISLFSVSASQKLTLQDCIKIASEKNFDIEFSKFQIKTAEANKLNAFGQYLPAMSANMNFNRRLNPRPGELVNVNGLLISIPGEEPNSYAINANASYLIFDGFARESAFDRAKYNLSASELNLDYNKQLITINVYNDFINLVRNYQIVQIRKENLELGNQDLERIKAQFEAGAIPINNVYSQEAEVGNREFDLISAENQYNNSIFNLLTTMGMQPDLSYQFDIESLPSEITENEILTFRRSLGDANTSVKSALNKRKDYQATEFNIKAAEEGIDISRTGYMPTLNAVTGLNWNNTQFEDFNRFTRLFFGLNLNIPIFDRFQTNAQIENAQLNLEQTTINQKRLEQNITTAVRSAYLNLDAAEKQLEITQKTLLSADKNYESAQDRFQVGAANITDVITANTQLITAKVNRINAVYSYILAQKEILFGIGLLN